MYAKGCRRATRAASLRGRRAQPVLVALGAVTMACSTAIGQGDPADVGKWTYPEGGPDWDEIVSPNHAVHLFTGQILVWPENTAVADPQLWNPDSGSFTAVAYSLHNIGCSGHVGLADGSILVAGGWGETQSASDEASIFSLAPGPSLDPWKEVGTMGNRRWYPTCTTLRDGKVLIVAGSDPCCTNGCAVKTPEIYDPATETWSTFPTDLTPEITRWYPFMFVVPDGNKVFFAGGSGGADCSGCDNDPYDCDSFILDIDAETWDYVTDNPMTFGGSSAVMYEPGLVLKCGGGANPASDRTEVIDLTAPFPIWQAEDSMTEGRRRHNLVLLPDGTILAIGGQRKDEMGQDVAVRDPELFDPNELIPLWRTMATAEYPHARHSTAVLMADGTVLAAGGEDFDPENKAEVFSPAYLFVPGGGDAPRPEIGFAPTAVPYDTNFSVILTSESPVTVEDIEKVSFVRLASVTHSFDQNQRYVPLTFEIDTAHFTALIVEAPADGSYAPPGYYMLFLISDDGVPSIAKYVRLTAPVTP